MLVAAPLPVPPALQEAPLGLTSVIADVAAVTLAHGHRRPPLAAERARGARDQRHRSAARRPRIRASAAAWSCCRRSDATAGARSPRARTSTGGRFRLSFRPHALGSRLVRVRFAGDAFDLAARRRLGRLNVYHLAGASWYGGGGGLACGGALTSSTLGVANKTLPVRHARDASLRRALRARPRRRPRPLRRRARIRPHRSDQAGARLRRHRRRLGDQLTVRAGPADGRARAGLGFRERRSLNLQDVRDGEGCSPHGALDGEPRRLELAGHRAEHRRSDAAPVGARAAPAARADGRAPQARRSRRARGPGGSRSARS